MDRDGGGWSLAVSWSVWKAVNLSCQPRLSVCQSWLSCVVSHPWGLPEQRLTVQTYGLISVTWNSQNCYISNLKIWKPKQKKKKEGGRPWHLVCVLSVVRFGLEATLLCQQVSQSDSVCWQSVSSVLVPTPGTEDWVVTASIPPPPPPTPTHPHPHPLCPRALKCHWPRQCGSPVSDAVPVVGVHTGGLAPCCTQNVALSRNMNSFVWKPNVIFLS